ncbi:hypothetical protein BGZ73_004563 [Actinomortierella ambigua]|nr:hypothetical protein BGZ73_004563 [Actinomortierella ambigua]
MIMLIIGRAIQGMGGGGLLSIAKMITADIVPRHRLGAYQGFTTITYIFSSTIGPLVGGIISDGASWRWTYFINLPIGGVTFLILAVLLHVKQPLTSSFRDRMATVDYMGILLLFISVIMILLGLNWGADAKYAWDSATILSLLIIGIVVGCLFLINEWRAGLAAKQPIIPLHLFGTRSLAANQVCMLFQSFVYLGQVFAIPLYFQATAGISGAQAGLNLLPLAATAASTECIVGFLMNFFNTTKEFIVLGYIIGTIGCMCLTLLLNEHTPRWQAMVLMIPQGMCLGFTFNAILLNVYSELYGHRDTATATALWAFLRSSGATMGIAAALASIQSSLSLVGAGDYANNIQAIKDLAPEIRGPIIHAFLTGMHRFMLVCTVLSGASLFCSFFIQRLPISRPTLPEKNQIDEPMQREKDVV